MPAAHRLDTAYHGDPQHYDRSRRLPPDVLQAIVRALQEAPLPGGWVLDVGAGSGRLALPLAEQGRPVLALDLSPEMLRHLQSQRRPHTTTLYPLLADAHHIPLRTSAAAAAFSVHTLHLVAHLEQALGEIERVVQPGGLFALGYIDHVPQAPIGWTLQAWRHALARRGYDLSRPMWRDYPPIVAAASRRFGAPRTVIAARWTRTVIPAEVLHSVSTRQFTPYWGLPDKEHAAVVAELRHEAQRIFGDLNAPQPDPRRFVWHFFTLPSHVTPHRSQEARA